VILEVYIGTAKKKKGWPDIDAGFGFDDHKDKDIGEDDDGDGETDTSKINAWSLLSQSLIETTLFASREHTKAGSRACLFLARCLLNSSSPTSTPSSEQVRSRIAQLYSVAHTSAFAKAAGSDAANVKYDGKESKTKKHIVSEGGKEREVQLLDWQEAVWSDWAEFDRQTRK